MKVDLTKVKTKQLDGTPVKYEKGNGIWKFIANILYIKVRDLDLVDIAMQMNKGQVVEMAKPQIQEMRNLITLENGVFAFARKEIFNYLDKIEEADKKK